MTLFKYKPYYDYNGPSRADPFRDRLDEEEASKNIARFFEEIGYYFEDGQATFGRSDEGVLIITTDLSGPDCDERVKRCLNGLDLFASKMRDQ